MASKAGAELDVLESQLNYALFELMHDCNETRQTSLQKAQQAWEAFRAAESEFAALA